MTAPSNRNTASITDILIEDLNSELRIEHDGTDVRVTIESEDEACAASVVMDRTTARKMARDLLEMTR